jgi:hypothetical protein
MMEEWGRGQMYSTGSGLTKYLIGVLDVEAVKHESLGGSRRSIMVNLSPIDLRPFHTVQADPVQLALSWKARHAGVMGIACLAKDSRREMGCKSVGIL